MEERKSYRFAKAWHLHLSDAFIQSHLLKSIYYSGYTFFFISMCVSWELNPQPFALLMQCSTTEPQKHWKETGDSSSFSHFYVYVKIGDNALLINNVHLFLNCNLFRYKLSMCRMTMQTICCYYKKYICRIRSLNQNVKWFKVASVKKYIFLQCYNCKLLNQLLYLKYFFWQFS